MSRNKNDCLLDDAAISASSLSARDYILAAVHGKRSTKNFVALVTKVLPDENLCEGEFMLRNGNNFLVSNSNDYSTIEMIALIT